MRTSEKCKTCGANFDDRLRINCGGDCLLCMAEAGDPDCVESAFSFLLEDANKANARIAELEMALQKWVDAYYEIKRKEYHEKSGL